MTTQYQKFEKKRKIANFLMGQLFCFCCAALLLTLYYFIYPSNKFIINEQQVLYAAGLFTSSFVLGLIGMFLLKDIGYIFTIEEIKSKGLFKNQKFIFVKEKKFDNGFLVEVASYDEKVLSRTMFRKHILFPNKFKSETIIFSL